VVETVQVLWPILRQQPLWVTLFVAACAVGVVLYMRARGASIDEHVSLSKATLQQMQALVTLNEQLNKQVESLQRKIEELEAKIEELEAELKKRGGP
jgi:peptidoglycan hydrolase CwlO-like protein